MSNWNRLYRNHFHKNAVVISFGAGSLWMQFDWLTIFVSALFSLFSGIDGFESKRNARSYFKWWAANEINPEMKKNFEPNERKKNIRIEMPVRFFCCSFSSRFFLSFLEYTGIPFPWKNSSMNNFSIVNHSYGTYGNLYNHFNWSLLFLSSLVSLSLFHSTFRLWIA